MQNFIKICPLGAELLHTDGRMNGRTDRHEESNSRFSHFQEWAYALPTDFICLS